jgi:xanthine dehydrogenase YagS FAD-binding subunit
MKPFTFTQAVDIPAAIRAREEDAGATYLGGGTNLVDLMKMNIESPSQLIDINGLAMKDIEVLADERVRIGALVRNSDLAWHPFISRHYPVLSQALLSGASPQLRNMATVGGNLLQRTRCPYFYDVSFPCNKRMPGSGCTAIHGYNRSHAVLGTSDSCIATHPSDMCVAMAALGAVVLVRGSEGERSIPFADFHLLPGDTPERETTLKPGELITAVELPPIPFAVRSHYLKVRDRASYEFALASAAVALDISNGSIRSARIALGGVGTRPWRSMEAEQALAGAKNNHASYEAAAKAALAGAITFEHNAFKPELARRTLIRALTVAGGMI